MSRKGLFFIIYFQLSIRRISNDTLMLSCWISCLTFDETRIFVDEMLISNPFLNQEVFLDFIIIVDDETLIFGS